MSSIRLSGGHTVVTVAVVLGVSGGGALWAANNDPQGALQAPVDRAASHSSPRVTEGKAPRKQHEADVLPRADVERSGVSDRTRGLVLPQSEPVSIEINRLGVKSSLVDLGIDNTGAMDVPGDPTEAGWYTRGPTPGALGPAVIAGHETWNQVPAVFFRLSELREGDRVQVARKDGQTAVFSVVKVVRYPKTQFPTREVYGALNFAGSSELSVGEMRAGDGVLEG